MAVWCAKGKANGDCEGTLGIGTYTTIVAIFYESVLVAVVHLLHRKDARCSVVSVY